MKKNRKYFAAAVIFAGIALIVLTSRIYLTEDVPGVPARTSTEALAQLANYTRISVEGDFALEISQLQDYRIEYAPLSAVRGELEARVENDTLIVRGFGNRTDTQAATVSIGVPVLDTLEVIYLPQITVRDFTAPLMNIRLLSFGTFAFQNNVIGNFNLEAQGQGIINLNGNTLTTRNIEAEGGSEVIITD